jgi:hypothetical protein
MSLAAGTRWSFQRIRVQIDTSPVILNAEALGATGGYCLRAIQRASGGTADISSSPPTKVVPSDCYRCSNERQFSRLVR